MIGAYDVYRGDILEVAGVPVVVEMAPLLGGPYQTLQERILLGWIWLWVGSVGVPGTE